MGDDTTKQVNDVRIAVIGTGFAGICMGIRLLKSGIKDFIILEKSGSIGGTWRDNTYPGAACDVVSHLYSYSFEPNPDWSRMFATQDEILTYTLHCVEKYGLRPFIRLNHDVTGGTFNEAAAQWRIHLKDREDITAQIWINGMGPLNRAVMPDISGLKDFTGTAFHSMHWRHDHDLSGKRVAVVGTGASAIQIVPNIAEKVGELHLYQRTAAWVLRKPDRPMKLWEQRLFRSLPFTQKLYRNFFYWLNELTVIALVKHPSLTRFIRAMALRHMSKAGLSAELKAKLTPDYTIGCKRILPSNNYYPTFLRPNVHLHTNGIDRIDGNCIISKDGTRTDVDTLILATGFEAADFPQAFKVKGRDGRCLNEEWKTGPEAYLGTLVKGFPNMFLIIGPNTGLGHSSMILMMEAQVNLILSCIREMDRRGKRSVEVLPDVQDAYNVEIQQRLEGTVWNSGCVSWYQTEDGKNTSLWPGHTFEFMRRTAVAKPAEMMWK